VDDDRFRLYTAAHRKARGFQWAAYYVFLAIILIALAGAGLGLVPELEKSRELNEAVALESGRLDLAKSALRDKQLRLQLLQHDVDYMELELRNSSRRSAKPGETLILIPAKRAQRYLEE
jgi:hypothetical protein